MCYLIVIYCLDANIVPSVDDMKYIKIKVASQNWHSQKGRRGVLEKGYSCEAMGQRLQGGIFNGALWQQRLNLK
ncbi:hypothetical protein DKX38_004037 [Salix brachista]|uniref:Uncharacterized protein n=1 Tax=Salix brachista TaxID=2182728 RepID=A0A5N5NBH6_9ROSI|nr:hypothetical protein DKX38_004037 [Salix brachista]